MVNFIHRLTNTAFTRPLQFFGTFFIVFTISHALVQFLFFSETGWFNLGSVLLLLMTPWVLFALLAAFGDASVGYIDEWLLDNLSTEDGEEVDAPGRLLLISGFFGLVISLGAAVASLFLGDAFTLAVSTQSLLLAFGAGVLEVIWMIFYFHGLNRGGALNATPLFQSIPVFSLIFGVLIFNEIPTSTQLLAVALFVVGALLLNYTPDTKKLDWLTITLILIASCIISFGFFIFKNAALSGNFVAALFGNGIGMGVASACIWSLWPPYRKQFGSFIKNLRPKVLLWQAGNESLYAVSTIANQLAIVLGPSVVVVSAFNAFHPVFTLLIGGTLATLGSTTHQKYLGGSRLYIKTAAIICIAAAAAIIVL